MIDAQVCGATEEKKEEAETTHDKYSGHGCISIQIQPSWPLLACLSENARLWTRKVRNSGLGPNMLGRDVQQCDRVCRNSGAERNEN